MIIENEIFTPWSLCFVFLSRFRNYSRDWLITGHIPNTVITIEILDCTLETGNNKGVCIIDQIYIYDGM